MTQEVQDGGKQLLLGKKLLELGFITPDQLREALSERARSAVGKQAAQLGDILVSKGYVTAEKVAELLSPRPDSEMRFQEREPSTPAPSLPTSQPPPGSDPTKLGKYKILDELGRGGMGVVYAALDTDLNRKVALKLMLSSPSADPKEVALEEERFVREAQLSAKLKHPNIVTVYEAGIIEGRRFLAMELVEGQAFCDWRKQGSITLRQQVSVLRDVALAVHLAHEGGILHRDLKPRNVLIGQNNQAFVTDFGLAKTMGTNVNLSLTASGAVVGTPAYMSPEQAQGLNRVDWRSDIWSLGIMLYEVLTGKCPFEGETPIEILMKVVRDPVPPPSKITGAWAGLSLDATIENICLKALAKDVKERYVTAKAFADDLTSWLKGDQIKVEAPRVRKPRKRVYVTAGVALVLALGAAAFTYLRPESDSDLQRARRLMDQKLYEEAADAYSRVLGRDPVHEEAGAGLKEAREKQKAAEQAELKRRIDEAVREAERFAKLAADKAKAEGSGLTEEQRKKLIAERRAAEELARLKEEEARKLREGITGKASSPTGSASEDPWLRAEKLLGLVDPSRDVVWGTWSVQDGKLASARDRHARVEIPFHPPEEYDLRVAFTRLGGSDAVALILSTRAGRTFALLLGAEGNTAAGLDLVGDARVGTHPASSRRPIVLQNHRVHTAVVKVRRDGVTATLDGAPVLAWKTDYSDLSLAPEWKLRGHLRLGLGCETGPVAFYAADLLEVTGEGKPAVALDPPPFKPVRHDAGRLRTGLVAEYFHGTDFEVLARRKIDPALNFRWGENPPWPGGPADVFSCRWTGYLYAPRTARYNFQAEADDGVRVVVDGVQVLANWTLRSDAAKGFSAVLERGYHSLSVEHFDSSYRAVLVLSWAEEGVPRLATVGAEAYFHDPTAFTPFTATPRAEAAGVLAEHTNSITSVAFRPDGGILASASEDRRVKLWDPVKKRRIADLQGHTMGVLAATFGMDGLVLASGGYDKRIKLWDPATESEFRTLEGHTAFVEALAFPPKEKLLASGGNDRTIRLWDPVTGSEVKTLSGHESGVSCLAFSPDGKLLASGGIDHTVRLWDVGAGTEIRLLAGHADAVESLVFTPDGKRLISAGWDGSILVWEVETGALANRLLAHAGEVFCLALSADGKTLASGGSDAMVRIWNLKTGQVLRVLPGHQGRILTVAFHPDNRRLASGGSDALIRVWDLKD